MTEQQLTITAQVINNLFTYRMIVNMYSQPNGDEILRLIVRDNIAGAADKITTALFDYL